MDPPPINIGLMPINLIGALQAGLVKALPQVDRATAQSLRAQQAGGASAGAHLSWLMV